MHCAIAFERFIALYNSLPSWVVLAHHSNDTLWFYRIPHCKLNCCTCAEIKQWFWIFGSFVLSGIHLVTEVPRLCQPDSVILRRAMRWIYYVGFHIH